MKCEFWYIDIVEMIMWYVIDVSVLRCEYVWLMWYVSRYIDSVIMYSWDEQIRLIVYVEWIELWGNLYMWCGQCEWVCEWGGMDRMRCDE